MRRAVVLAAILCLHCEGTQIQGQLVSDQGVPPGPPPPPPPAMDLGAGPDASPQDAGEGIDAGRPVDMGVEIDQGVVLPNDPPVSVSRISVNQGVEVDIVRDRALAIPDVPHLLDEVFFSQPCQFGEGWARAIAVGAMAGGADRGFGFTRRCVAPRMAGRGQRHQG